MSNCEEIVTSEENEDLIKPFSENEINVAVWSCYEEGATGLMVSLSLSITNSGNQE